MRKRQIHHIVIPQLNGKQRLETFEIRLIFFAFKISFRERLILSNDTVVLIENQISPIANRMKTVQGMLTQYFVDNGVENIQYISSKNKLKIPELYGLTEFINSEQTSYNKRKHLSVDVTRAMLLNKEEDKWKTHFEDHKKKDDLADSYLQGLWWIRSTKTT